MFVLPKKTKIAQHVRDNGFKTYSLPFVELSKRPLDIVFYLPSLLANGLALAKFAKKFDVKIIHVNDYYNLIGTIAKLLVPSIKLVTHIRKLPDSSPLIINRFWLEIHKIVSDTIIVVSNAVQNQLPHSYPSNLIYDGIHGIEKYSLHDCTTETDKIIRILYLGHFIPGKGQDYALQAFWRAYKKCKDIRLRYVGGDMGIKKNKKFRQLLQNKTMEWNITDVVEFKGNSFHIDEEIKEADMMLNFSESESFSFTCFEALYYGTPLIASDSGGPKEQFRHMESGYLVPNRDVHAMAEAILYLVRNPEIMKAYSIKSQKFVRENFSFSKTTEKLNEFYMNLIY
jgi:glycosyltransferase involved in cell wall biosynthesis|tara:strand:+ start:6471 stop:7493 length:1023 start_codon:yes stop_codon:yes gene_type:complete